MKYLGVILAIIFLWLIVFTVEIAAQDPETENDTEALVASEYEETIHRTSWRDGSVYQLTPELPQYESDALDWWLLDLIKFECPWCKVGEDFRHLDVNGKYSYGCLQFQEATWDYYRAKYADFKSPDIYSCVQQFYLARQMFLNEPGAYMNWYTSVVTRGLGLPPTLQ